MSKVVDEDGKVVPIGTPGELYIRGYSNMLGYWGDENKTNDILSSDNWLRTGYLFNIPVIIKPESNKNILKYFFY